MIDFSLFLIASVRNGESRTPLFRTEAGNQIIHVEYDGKTWAYAFPADWAAAEFKTWAESVGFLEEFDKNDGDEGSQPKISSVDPSLIVVPEEEPMFMNIETGSVDTRDGWDYVCEETGYWVNAVARGEVVEVVKNANGDWVAK